MEKLPAAAWAPVMRSADEFDAKTREWEETHQVQFDTPFMCFSPPNASTKVRTSVGGIPWGIYPASIPIRHSQVLPYGRAA